MKLKSKKIWSAVAVASMTFPCVALATNGMNLEGYGPIALGMGGASYAYDNGTAAVMNNPATLALAPEGHRLDLALGFLGPDVRAKYPGAPDATSSSNAFWMPAIGWMQKKNQFAFGAGVFAQGGMGTEYSGDSFMAAGSGETVRSEVSVGRFIVPLTYDINPMISIGASLDFVWAGMDIKMAMSGAQFGDMVADFGGSQAAGTASGTMVQGLLANIGPGNLLEPPSTTGGPINWARFDFSNNNKFTGEAFGTGFGGKIGAVFKVNPQLTVGLTYHSKTALSDLETDNATVSMSANVDTGLASGNPATNTYTPQTIAVKGKIKVLDFQWPATYGIGMAYKPNSKFMLAADIKRIAWADVMKSFKLHFTADSSQEGLAAGFVDSDLDATLFQDWKDQTVVALGGAYQITNLVVLRAGFNHAANPIPSQYLNALFPAIVVNHVTVGFGYKINNASTVDFAYSRAAKASDTNPGNNVTSEMSQNNFQVMYSYRY